MVYFLALYKLHPSVTEEKLEEMIRSSRSQLLRIPEVLHLQTGRSIPSDAEWPFFVAISVESVERLRMCLEDPFFIKFKEEVIRPFTTECMDLRYEMEPGKNLKYS
ncbi:MAG: Dabb family protein [Verrucomicrobia bacterium]|jgi:hypothetical protein|nr:Dabb family protein [Verrucomicrobiota bacterium]